MMTPKSRTVSIVVTDSCPECESDQPRPAGQLHLPDQALSVPSQEDCKREKDCTAGNVHICASSAALRVL